MSLGAGNSTKVCSKTPHSKAARALDPGPDPGSERTGRGRNDKSVEVRADVPTLYKGNGRGDGAIHFDSALR